MPHTIQLYQRVNLLCFGLTQESIHKAVESFNLSFGLRSIGLTVQDANAEPCQRVIKFLGDVLLAIVQVEGIGLAELQDGLVEGVLHDTCFLVVVPAGRKDPAAVVINEGRQVCLAIFSVRAREAFRRSRAWGHSATLAPWRATATKESRVRE